LNQDNGVVTLTEGVGACTRLGIAIDRQGIANYGQGIFADIDAANPGAADVKDNAIGSRVAVSIAIAWASDPGPESFVLITWKSAASATAVRESKQNRVRRGDLVLRRRQK
jgi:hypothetical protein